MDTVELPKLIELENDTNDIVIEVFHTGTPTQVLNPKSKLRLNPRLTLPECTASQYDPVLANTDPPFLCLRDVKDIHNNWIRFFADKVGDHVPTLVHHSKNTWADRVQLTLTTVNDHRDNGLYLKVYWKEDSDAARKLWIVGEIVQDVLGGGE